MTLQQKLQHRQETNFNHLTLTPWDNPREFLFLKYDYEKNIMLLTNQNVVLIKKDEICSFDFDEVGEIFEARQDETLAGVVDIFDETDELI